jgi:uncharacterized protein YndB with AHSA1/START domain
MTDPNDVAASDETVLITHIFDAPRERVFAAWTDPAQVSAWFGPEQWDTPPDKVHIEPRIGGRYELTMVQRESGAEHPLKFEIVELVEPELIVLRCGPMPEIGLPNGTVTRVELHAHGEKTRMTLSDGPYPTEMRGGTETGWHAAIAKLAALLAR